MSKVYINGAGVISPQETFQAISFLEEPVLQSGTRKVCIEPDYAPWIDIKNIRRMSRVIRMGVATAGLALKEAGVTTPDGIITGTGYGCLDDTGIFLSKMILNNEQSLNPTPFIQSTHNSIGSQIGLLLRCLGYNQTYVQGSFSLECSLQDALMLLADGEKSNLLVGAVDEITDISHAVLSRFGLYRGGASHGEGSGYFMLSSQQQESSYAELAGVGMLYNPESADEIETRIKEFLRPHAMTPNDIDFVLLGTVGDDHFDKLGNAVAKSLWKHRPAGRFKHLCGEYPTATGFALWLAASILRRKSVPAVVNNEATAVRNILIYNPYFNKSHSFILLKAL